MKNIVKDTKHLNVIVIYKKFDKDIFIRTYSVYTGKNIGEKNTMGWEVLNVLYYYEGNYYQYGKYKRIIREKIRKQQNEKRIRKAIKKSIYNFLLLKLRKMQKQMY